MKICIQNLRKYNEGELVFEWISLPREEEELQASIDYVLSFGGEEIMIAGSEDIPFQIGTDIFKINECAIKLRDIQEAGTPNNIINTVFSEADEDEIAFSVLESGDYRVLNDIDSYESLAEYLVDEENYLGEIAPRIREHLDWQSIGNELEEGGQWIITDDNNAVLFYD